MGLTVRGDPPRKINVEGLEWGPETEGVRLSIREKDAEVEGQLPDIVVVMKNFGLKTWKLSIPGWMFFHEVATTAPLTAFGRQLFMPGRRQERVEITLGPGDATETDIPLCSLYEMEPGEEYPVSVSSKLADGVVVQSNRITVRR